MNKYIVIFLTSMSFSVLADNFSSPLSIKFDPSEIAGKGFVNGVRYSRAASDSSALFEGEIKNHKKNNSFFSGNHWSVACDEDVMTDKKSCTVSDISSNLFIIVGKNGVSAISLLGHDFPGKKASIRIGKGKPMVIGMLTGGRAKNLFRKLKRGTVISTRHYEWPYDYPKDGKATIYGLQEAVDYGKWVVNGQKSVSKPTTIIQAVKKSPKNNSHSHNGRTHSHALPPQGKAHRHGNGAIGQ